MLHLSSLFKKLVWLSLSSLNLRVIVPSRVFGILNFSIVQFKRIRKEALPNKVVVNVGNIIHLDDIAEGSSESTRSSNVVIAKVLLLQATSIASG